MGLKQQEIINVGLVGYGYWGPNLLRNLMIIPGCRVVACCDKHADRLDMVGERYPGVKLISDYREMLAMPELDAVIVATPVNTHYQLAAEALTHGKHVFVEKPMATTSVDARDLVDKAKARGLVLMVGHTFLYSPPVIKIKELIDSGALGEIYYISSSRVNLGIHQPDVSVIWDLAPHDFSIIFYWLSEEPTFVSASGRDFIQRGLHDVAFIDLDFPSGAVAHVQDSWLSPAKRRQMTIVGSEKMVVYDDTNLEEQVRIFDKSVCYVDDPDTFGKHQLTYRTGDITTPRLEALEPLATELSHYIDCIVSGMSSRTDGLHGLAIVKALEAADRSINNGGGKQPVGSVDFDSLELVAEKMELHRGVTRV